jgi:hypothetical protein
VVILVNKELVEKYLGTYFSTIIDEDAIKNQKKKVNNLLEKFADPESVFNGLPIYCVNLEEQAKLLHFILEESDERQIVSNLGKVDADKDYYNIVIDDEDSAEFAITSLGKVMPDYEPLDINSILISNRIVIRGRQEIQGVLDHLKQSNEVIIRSLLSEINFFCLLDLHFEDLTSVKEYIDCIINNILQLVVYRVIYYPDIDTLTFLQELSDETRNLSHKVDAQLILKREEQKKNDALSASQVMRYFSAYLRHRSKLKEETNIYMELEKEKNHTPTLFDSVPKEYLAAKVILSEEDIKTATSIITEGKSIYRYDEKLATVREFIDIMRVYGGRQCYSNCLQDLKVYFREIYISKATFRRQQARTIVEDYIKKINFAVGNNETIPEFDRQSQYMFVREKISRGYFREKGLLSDYFGKIKFTNELYDLLLKTYSFYDSKDALEFLYDVNNNLLNKFRALDET